MKNERNKKGNKIMRDFSRQGSFFISVLVEQFSMEFLF